MFILSLVSTLFPYTTLFRSLAFGEVRMRGQVARRRTIHFGWTYGYETWRVEPGPPIPRSEEHTSELQSHHDLVCRLLLEKKKMFILWMVAMIVVIIPSSIVC